MLPRIVSIFFLALCVSLAGSEQIARDQLVEMFANIKSNTKWDMEGKMVWGYFFTHPTREPLVAAGRELEKKGYRVVSVFEGEDKKLWWLHAEKIEVHSVDSLHTRNQEFYRFAEKMKLHSYDGMDVGPISDAKKG